MTGSVGKQRLRRKRDNRDNSIEEQKMGLFNAAANLFGQVYERATQVARPPPPPGRGGGGGPGRAGRMPRGVS
ncbi:hypothetical protein FS792_15040 [Pseudomonas aeruginosa]|nr:hypothetical protein FS792_15040 [Pseudomonas aeruginosa]